MPAGAQHWLYNDGDAPLVAVYVFDENNNINQLEPSMRKFLLAGGFSKGQPHFAENIFKGIDARFLSEALGVSMHVAEKLQSRRDQRGEIVRVEPEHGFHQLNPSPSSSSFSFPSSQVQYQTCQRDVDRHNVCAMEVRHSVERLDQADVYSRQLLIVPQGYLVATKAQGEGFQYIAFETNPDTMVSHVAGKNSVLSDLPAAVIASSYAISMEEAAELKNGRKHELAVLTPAGSGSYQQGQAGSAQQ
ncbi:legumin1 [Zea mays]|uniref:Legumin1 n=1 Tax=Zea mays TaxID=4577 RepID=A0A1D6LHZ3_MAIZE|nr:legumin1 [Zea mays]